MNCTPSSGSGTILPVVLATRNIAPHIIQMQIGTDTKGIKSPLIVVLLMNTTLALLSTGPIMNKAARIEVSVNVHQLATVEAHSEFQP
jgi:hypothetical protein